MAARIEVAAEPVMAQQKNIGLTLFAVCCAVYVKTAFLAPTDEELKDESIARQNRDYGGNRDPARWLHGLRYYILGVGGIGLLIALEDYFIERAKARKLKPPEGSNPAEKSDSGNS